MVKGKKANRLKMLENFSGFSGLTTVEAFISQKPKSVECNNQP